MTRGFQSGIRSMESALSREVPGFQFPVSRSQRLCLWGRIPPDMNPAPALAATRRTATARGGTPGTTPHNVLRALKGHTEQGALVIVRPVGAMCHGLG